VSNPEDPKSSEPPRRVKRYEDDEPPSESKSQALIAWVMLVVIAVLGTFLYFGFQKAKVEAKKKAEEATRLAAEQSRADSLQRAVDDSLRAVRADSLAKIAPKKPAAPPPGATPTAGGAETPPPPEKHYGIDVGTYLSEDRANAEQAKIQAAASLSGKVMPVTEDGVTSYRVVMGDFTSKGDAEKKANELIAASQAREARVIPLK
jgi:cell division protein FtsN